MRQWLSILLLILQLSLFLLARIFDDISWYVVDIYNEQDTCQGIAIAALSIAVILNFIRKWQNDGILKIMLFKSQIKFLIPWSLEILIVILFFSTFGCEHQMPQTEGPTIFLFYQSCCLNGAQLLLTNLNFSFAVNTKTHIAELVVYEAVLFAQIIFNGHLLISFVHELQEHPKDLSLLLTSVIIANQILIMDLMFRGAFQGRELEESEQKLGKEISMVNHEVITARKISTGVEMVPQRPHTHEFSQVNY